MCQRCVVVVQRRAIGGENRQQRRDRHGDHAVVGRARGEPLERQGWRDQPAHPSAMIVGGRESQQLIGDTRDQRDKRDMAEQP